MHERSLIPHLVHQSSLWFWFYISAYKKLEGYHWKGNGIGYGMNCIVIPMNLLMVWSMLVSFCCIVIQFLSSWTGKILYDQVYNYDSVNSASKDCGPLVLWAIAQVRSHGAVGYRWDNDSSGAVGYRSDKGSFGVVGYSSGKESWYREL